MKLSRIVVCVAAVIAANEHRRCQAKLVPRKHLDWEAHRDRLVQERQFKRYYRMGVVTFEELVESLKPMVERDGVKSRNRTDIGPISPVNKVLKTISWLAGGSFH
ncbi:hypothetical protein GQ600_27160 [Phytophthora cactorum]|nr:hypothetical protein GQ600_27160 [Phytophthora cactorum]